MEPHEHDFHDEDAEWTADENIICTIPCSYREVYDATTSEQYDETFYDEGPRCEETREDTWEFEGIYSDRDEDWYVEVTDDLDKETFEKLSVEAAEKVESDWGWKRLDPRAAVQDVPVTFEGDRYIVRYE